MQRFFKTAAVFALTVALLGTAAMAATITNKSDASAWITIYSGARQGIIASFCLAPGQHAEIPDGGKGFVVGPSAMMYPVNKKPYELRAEVTHKNCAHPVMLDATLGYDGTTPYYVHGSAGRYAFRHTP